MSTDIFGSKSTSEYPPLPYKLHNAVIGKERKYGLIILGTIEKWEILDPKYVCVSIDICKLHDSQYNSILMNIDE